MIPPDLKMGGGTGAAEAGGDHAVKDAKAGSHWQTWSKHGSMSGRRGCMNIQGAAGALWELQNPGTLQLSNKVGIQPEGHRTHLCTQSTPSSSWLCWNPR